MKKIIISIGREFGSGGRRIGELLAKELEVPCYDRHLIEEAACCSGFETKELEEADEMKANRFLFKVPAKSNQYTGYGKPMNDTLFAIKSELIRKYADAGSCVIVGRCADKVLEKQEGLISVFMRLWRPGLRKSEGGMRQTGRRLFILSVRPIKSEEIIITITLRKSGGTEAATT
mgnify:CR=1 FL=1